MAEKTNIPLPIATQEYDELNESINKCKKM